MSATVYAQKFTVANSDGVKIKYEVTSATAKTVQVTGGDRPDELIIPATVDYQGVTYAVTAIERKAYRPATKLVHRIRRLVLPEGLVEIGDHAFMMAFLSNGLESIYIPSSVKKIGKSAFSKAGMGPSGNPRTCQLENLPSFVNEINCEIMGLTKECVSMYFTYHPRTAAPVQQALYALTNPQQTTVPSTQPVQQQTAPKPSSDVDVNIPNAGVSNSNTFAIIIANENYQEEVNVDYALNDGEMFKEYCNKVLGVPEDNIHLRKDATLNNMRKEMEWITKVAQAYDGQARVIVYYAGHGVPDEKSGTSYLLPIDGSGSSLSTGYSLADFYRQLGDLPVRDVVVFMDACFSGSKRGEGMLASARGVAIKAKPQAPKGKMVVFSAAQGDETAYPLADKAHGMFTYFLLKKLQETKGNVSLQELGTYVTDQVKRKSIVANGKSQTPTVVPSATVAGSWKTMKLK